MQPEPHTMLELIGLRPVIVDDLGRPAVMLAKHGLIIVDSAADLHRVADWALARAASRLSRPR